MARGFMERCRYAREAFIRREDSREADNCFEMYDGALVVTMLMRWAQRDQALSHAICAWMTPVGIEKWKQTAARYRHLQSEDDLAREAARIRRQERLQFRRQQSLWLSKAAAATEPTAAGLQYVIPGCEKDRARSSKSQLELF